jgi:hypothetical protein
MNSDKYKNCIICNFANRVAANASKTTIDAFSKINLHSLQKIN